MADEVKPPLIPTCETWTLSELLEKEKEMVGIYISAHPLDSFKFEMAHYGITPLIDIDKSIGRTIRIAGFVTDASHRVSKKGTKFGSMVLNDFSGNFEIMMWEKNYLQYNSYIDNGQTVMIQGVYAEHPFRPGVFEFAIQKILLLTEVKKALTKRVSVLTTLDKIDAAFVQTLTENIKTNPGNTELVLHVRNQCDSLTKLKTATNKIALNDPLIEFFEANEHLKISVEIL